MYYPGEPGQLSILSLVYIYLTRQGAKCKYTM